MARKPASTEIQKSALAVTRARAQLISEPQFRFFGVLALQMELKTHPDVDTMATDGRDLYHCPAFVLSLTAAQLKGVVAHEVLHPASLHHTRRGTRDLKRWNRAADYAINPLVIAAGLELPKFALVDVRFKGMGAEQIYSILEKEDAAEKAKREEEEKHGKSQPSPQGQAPGQGKPSQTPQNAPGQGQGASGGDGKPGQGAGESNDPGGCGGILDAAPPSDPAAREKAEFDAQERTRQAIMVCKNSPASQLLAPIFDRLTDTLNAPTVSWREEVRRFADKGASKEASFTRPNRRFIGSNMIMPGYVSVTPAHLAVVGDSSGSMDVPALAAIVSEAQSMLDEGAADRVTLIWCDDQVRGVQEFERGDIIAADPKGNPKGGGDTNFRPAFAWIAENLSDVSAVLYLTDMMTSDFGDEPACPVLWCKTPVPLAFQIYVPVPPFGESITIDIHA